MALRFDLSRHRYLAGAVHARAWLTMREQFGLAPNTLDAYARAVHSYFAFMELRDHDCEAGTQSDVASWINESRARGLANSTLIQRVTALRLFFEYLVEEGLRPGNPVSRGGAFSCCGTSVYRTAGPIRRVHRRHGFQATKSGNGFFAPPRKIPFEIAPCWLLLTMELFAGRNCVPSRSAILILRGGC